MSETQKTETRSDWFYMRITPSLKARLAVVGAFHDQAGMSDIATQAIEEKVTEIEQDAWKTVGNNP